jgi:O-antigen ligase
MMDEASYFGRRAPEAAAVPVSADQGSVRPSTMYGLLLALAITGYPIASALTTILVVEGSVISYAFRSTVIVVAAAVFVKAMAARVLYAASPLIVLFLVLYLARLYIDFFARDLPEAGYSLLYFLGICVLPAAGLTAAAQYYEEKRAAICLLIVAGLGASSVLLLNALQLTSYASTTEETGRLSFASLNAISVGYTGLFLMVAASSLWSRIAMPWRLGLLPAALIGAVCLIQAASRGPIVAGVVCVAAVAYVRRQWFLFFVFAAMVIYGGAVAHTEDFAIIERFQNLSSDLSATERRISMMISIEQALASPIFGHAYVETLTFTYPHNLLIESGLALGVVGFVLMLFMQIKLLFFALRLLREGRRLFPFLTLIAVVNANLSAALFGAADFWIVASISFAFLHGEKVRRNAALQTTGTTAAPPAYSAP